MPGLRGVLKLKQETTGAVYTGGADSPSFQIRLARRMLTLRKATARALAESRLA